MNMMKLFEVFLRSCRQVVLLAVAASLLAVFAMFYMASIDILQMIFHRRHYASSELGAEA